MIFFKGQIQRIRHFFIEEEYKTERIISLFRAITYFGILMELFGLKYFFREKISNTFIWIIVGFVVFSLLMMIDLFFMARIKKAHLFIPSLKYFVSGIDSVMILLLSLIMARFFGNNENGDFIFSLVFLLGSSLLFGASLFRYHPTSIVMTGSLLLILFIAAFFLRHHNRDLMQFFFDNKTYQIQNVVAFWYFVFLTPLSAFLAYRIRVLVTKSRQQEMLERFLPQSIVEEMEKGQLSVELGGEKRNITVLFSDIRNFTGFSEKRPAEEVVDFLNSYFNDMIEAVFKHKGTVDKMIGDGLMAFFGAPYVDGHEADRAVHCAIEMQTRLKSFNELQKIKGEPEIRIGVGVHSGEAIVGNIGSQKRMEFTAIGDTVNTASRLETLTKKHKVPILISESTQKLLTENFKLDHIGDELLKGKNKEVNVFSVEL